MKNSRVLLLNMTIVFSNSSFKIPKQVAFGLIFNFFLFWMKLWILKNSRGLISNMTVVFQNHSPKVTKQCVFSPKFKGFLFAANFVFRWIWGVELKVGLSPSKKTCVIWKPSKNYEKCFLFYLKSSFRSQNV